MGIPHSIDLECDSDHRFQVLSLSLSLPSVSVKMSTKNSMPIGSTIELSSLTLAPPGEIDDPDGNYSDIEGVVTDPAAGLFPEVIITTLDMGTRDRRERSASPPVSARSTTALVSSHSAGKTLHCIMVRAHFNRLKHAASPYICGSWNFPGRASYSSILRWMSLVNGPRDNPLWVFVVCICVAVFERGKRGQDFKIQKGCRSSHHKALASQPLSSFPLGGCPKLLRRAELQFWNIPCHGILSTLRLFGGNSSPVLWVILAFWT